MYGVKFNGILQGYVDKRRRNRQSFGKMPNGGRIMIKYVAGIDAGTTGLKTIIFDLQGRAIGKDYEEYPCITPRVGWVEQDVYCLWNALCHTVKGAIANAGVDPKEIGSVGISSQRGTFFAIDENWEPLHNSIVWSDGRAVEEVQWIKENIGVEKYHKISGAPVSGAWSYAKYQMGKRSSAGAL